MKISITHYGMEHSIVTDTLVDYNNPDTLDDTDCNKAVRAFMQVMLSAGYLEESIIESFLNIQNEE
jgi:hypothetical protein